MQIPYNFIHQAKRISLLLFFCLRFINGCEAQFFAQSSDDVKPYPVGIRIDLVAKDINPGFRLALEYPRSNTVYRTLRDNNDRKEINSQLLLVPALTYYTNPGKQQALLAETEMIKRRKNDRGFFTELGLGIGAAYIFGADSTKGLFTKAVPSGFFAAPSVSLGLGSDLFQVTDGRYKYLWNIRVHVPVLYPVSKNFFPLYMLQGGIAFYLPKKWVRNQQFRVVSRSSYN